MSTLRDPVYCFIIVVLILIAGQAYAQQEDAEVTFKFAWKDGRPSDYVIAVNRSGRLDYVSDDHTLSASQVSNQPVESNAEQLVQARDAAAEDTFKKQFQASEPLRQKIFALAERLNFFDGQFEYIKHPVAQTGTKILGYQDASRHTSTTYNYSEDPSIQELTSIFQGISVTIESGRKLEFDRRFDKLSLDEDLRAMEELSSGGRLYEVQAIAPLLERLSTDRTVLHIARQRAERILRKAGLPVAPTPAQ